MYLRKRIHTSLLLLALVAAFCFSSAACTNDSSANDNPDGSNQKTKHGGGSGGGSAGSGDSAGGGGSAGTVQKYGYGGGDTVSNVTDKVNAGKVDSVDLMFIIDKSKSMIQEQSKIRDQYERLIKVLSSGDKNSDGTPDFQPVTSLHLAVVTSDLGLPVIAANDNLDPTTCNGNGDDGNFQNTPHPTQGKVSLLAIVVVSDENDCSAGA